MPYTFASFCPASIPLTLVSKQERIFVAVMRLNMPVQSISSSCVSPMMRPFKLPKTRLSSVQSLKYGSSHSHMRVIDNSSSVDRRSCASAPGTDASGPNCPDWLPLSKETSWRLPSIRPTRPKPARSGWGGEVYRHPDWRIARAMSGPEPEARRAWV